MSQVRCLTEVAVSMRLDSSIEGLAPVTYLSTELEMNQHLKITNHEITAGTYRFVRASPALP